VQVGAVEEVSWCSMEEEYVQIVPNSCDVMYDGHVEQEGAALRCFSD
jgi:hypothetical protein